MLCSGGFRYRPTTSVNFSRNLASRDSLNVFVRCGFRLCLFQMLFMVDLLTFCASAIVRQLQCVIPFGLLARSHPLWTRSCLAHISICGHAREPPPTSPPVLPAQNVHAKALPSRSEEHTSELQSLR